MNSVFIKDAEIEKEGYADQEFQVGFTLNRFGVLFNPTTSNNTPYILAKRVEDLFKEEKQFDIRTLGFDSILYFYYSYKVADNGLFIRNKGIAELSDMSTYNNRLLELFPALKNKHRDTIITASEELTRIATLIDQIDFEKAHEVLDYAIKTNG